MLTSPHRIARYPALSVTALTLSAFFLSIPAAAQDISVREKMEQSIARQKAAVHRQTGVDFFATPWTTPAIAPPAPLSTPAPDVSCPAMAHDEIEPMIAAAAKEHRVKPKVLRAVIRQESGFHACAVSAKGAMGLMQIMPETAGELGLGDPFDAAANIQAGARYLRQMLDRFDGDIKLALAAYNAGPERVSATAPEIPNIAETRDYVARIVDMLGKK